jgi:hypothetical protein
MTSTALAPAIYGYTPAQVKAAQDAAPAWAQSIYTAVALADLPADLTTATPPQIDEAIRTLDLEAERVNTFARRLQDAVREAIGQQATQERRGPARSRYTVASWPTDWSVALEQATALPANTPSKRRYAYGETVGDALAAYGANRAEYSQITSRTVPLHDEFHRRGGWTRYYRVDNANGHVHVTTNCPNTYPTTRWQWPTNLSGADGDQVVEYAGELTCLTCFPEQREEILRDRPVRFDMFETREQRDERLRREREADARTAEKIAKGVTPDGKPLLVRWEGRTNEVRTEKAAQLRYIDCMFGADQAERRAAARSELADEYASELADEYAFEAAEYRAAAAFLAEALAWKRGRSVEQIVADLDGKVAKRIARGY